MNSKEGKTVRCESRMMAYKSSAVLFPIHIGGKLTLNSQAALRQLQNAKTDLRRQGKILAV